MQDYLAVLVLLGIGLCVGLGAVGLSHFFGHKQYSFFKDQPFECGEPILGDTGQRISVRFYLVGILFLLFDVEVIFFYPWAIVFRDFLSLGSFIVLEMGLFLGILVFAYLYVLGKKALDWE